MFKKEWIWMDVVKKDSKKKFVANKIKKIMAEGESEFLVCTKDEIHHLFPRGTNDDTEYDYEIHQ